MDRGVEKERKKRRRRERNKGIEIDRQTDRMINSKTKESERMIV